MPFHKLTVSLESRSYPIHIGSGLTNTGSPAELVPRLRGEHGVVITNTTVAPLYLKRVQNWLLRAGYTCSAIILPDGEEYKNHETLLGLYQDMFEAGLQRNSFVCALGGGVVGDLAGYAAATYMRGVDLLQIPTTILAQVDSAIGGKNGVNMEGGKNLVGTTYQPVAVISDVDFIATLPEREILSGLGEVLKYGLLAGDDFISFLEMNQTEILARDPRSLATMIHFCSRIKTDYVVRDEYDRLGVRAALNLGHTVGHALEKLFSYQRFTHGEAVAIGLVASLLLAHEMGLLSEAARDRSLRLLGLFGLPMQIPDTAEVDKIIELMRRDKKAEKSLSMLLLHGLGDPHLENDIDPLTLCKVLQECK
ncbi:MAG: 3-dehydroquinate synthase, partial [Deltaproteobacteria bacterium]|nr:3-dehydroquinate synthase [Deltaproteobacteria bacterium]